MSNIKMPFYHTEIILTARNGNHEKQLLNNFFLNASFKQPEGRIRQRETMINPESGFRVFFFKVIPLEYRKACYHAASLLLMSLT